MRGRREVLRVRGRRDVLRACWCRVGREEGRAMQGGDGRDGQDGEGEG